jgi:hypothetical protein
MLCSAQLASMANEARGPAPAAVREHMLRMQTMCRPDIGLRNRQQLRLQPPEQAVPTVCLHRNEAMCAAVPAASPSSASVPLMWG